MHPRVKSVKPLHDYKLKLTFTNGEIRVFDVRTYLSRGVFQELANEAAFKKVKAKLGSIQWQSGQDFCPDTLYLESRPLRNTAGKQAAGKIRRCAESRQ